MWATGSALDVTDGTIGGGCGPLLRMVWGHELRSDTAALGHKRVPVIIGSALIELSLYSFHDGGGAISPGDFVLASSNPVAIRANDVDERWVCDIVKPADLDGLSFWQYGIVVKGTAAEPSTVAEGGNSPILIQLYDAPRYVAAYDHVTAP